MFRIGVDVNMKKIMVVDDEPDQTFTLECSLKNMSDDFEVITVNSGTDCLQMLNKDVIPDLILLDIMMPKMNGWEVYDKVKSNPKFSKIPIVFLTARTDDIAKNAGSFLGEDYIEKPYDTTEVIKRINKILDKQ